MEISLWKNCLRVDRALEGFYQNYYLINEAFSRLNLICGADCLNYNLPSEAKICMFDSSDR